MFGSQKYPILQNSANRRNLSARSKRSISECSSERSSTHRTTSGKGHVSLNFSQRMAAKVRIENENLKLLDRMQSVKSTLPTHEQFNQHFKNHKVLRKRIGQIRFATPSRSQRSNSPRLTQTHKFTLNLQNKDTKQMDRDAYNRKFNNPGRMNRT